MGELRNTRNGGRDFATDYLRRNTEAGYTHYKMYLEIYDTHRQPIVTDEELRAAESRLREIYRLTRSISRAYREWPIPRKTRSVRFPNHYRLLRRTI